MAKKLLSEAYQEFLDGQLNKRIQDFLSSRTDEAGNIIKEGVTQADLDDWIENGIKKSFYNDLNSVQGQIHYQEDFFKQLNRNRTPLDINGKSYMLSGDMNYIWDPDTKLYSSKVSLHPLDIPEGDTVRNYNLDNWIGSSKYNIETPGVGIAYSSNLNKIINNPNISISDMTRDERKQRWADVRNSLKDGKTFEWSDNAEEVLGKSQKMVRLQQGKGKHRTSRPIRESEPTGPKRGDQFYNPKTKRQFVYDGPDDIVKGGHNLISDQGHVWLSYMDELESGPGPGRSPLDYDTLKGYNDALTEMSVLSADRSRRQFKDPENYFEELDKNLKDIRRYEREVKKKIKNHRMDTGDHKMMKYLQSQTDRYYQDNPKAQRKQLEKQKKKADKEVKKINRQTDKDLKNLEKKHEERKKVEEANKMNEKVKDTAAEQKDATAQPETNHTTVEENIKNTSETVKNKADDVLKGEPQKMYADWIESFPSNVGPIVTNHDHIETIKKWANATDEGIDEYVKSLSGEYKPESVEFIGTAIRDQRERAQQLLKERADAFNDPTLVQDPNRKNLFVSSEHTGVKAEGLEMPLSEDEVTKTVNDTVRNVMDDLGIEEDFIVNTVFGKIDDDALNGEATAYAANIYADNIWANTKRKVRTKKRDELRKQHMDMTDDEFTDWMFDHSDLLDVTADDFKEALQETTAHETRHFWQNTNKEAHEKMSGKHQSNFKNFDDYLNNELEVDARNYAKEYAEKVKNGHFEQKQTSQQNIPNDNTNMPEGNTSTPGDNTKAPETNMFTPEQQQAANDILDEALNQQRNANRFGNTNFIIDQNGNAIVNPANGTNISNNVNNTNKTLGNGYLTQGINQVNPDGTVTPNSGGYQIRQVAGGGGGNGNIPPGNNLPVPVNPTPGSGNFSTSSSSSKVVSKLDQLKNMSFMDKLGTMGNIIGAVSDYKNARREGHGVASSALRAGAQFVLGEALGWWVIPYEIMKHVPGGIIKGTEALYKENRRMNSAANNQLFGGVQFQDTQQLATMRQSGMEMAKMAQYNLQQTLMGQEATYLHR